MKLFTILLTVVMVSVSSAAQAAVKKNQSPPPWMIGTMKGACMMVKMSCDYQTRYSVIDKVYYATGKAMFERSSNPYSMSRPSDQEVDKHVPPRYYIGTHDQNAKLMRNIYANKALFKDGLSMESAKRWKMVK